MISWILIAILAYLLFAINGIADKFLLSRDVGDPAVYVFYVGIGSLVVFALAPFGLHLVSFSLLLIALAAGLTYALALYYFYTAIKYTSISRILPIEGGLVPLFSLALAYGVGVETLTRQQFVAFGLLVAGAVLLEFKKTNGSWHPLSWKSAIIAAFLFALSLTLTKYVYNYTNFVSGLVWTRLGLALGAMFTFCFPAIRRRIKRAVHETSTANKALFYGAHVAGSGATVLQNYAISIGSVVIINALQGIQFMFLLILSVFLSKYYPRILKEDVHGRILLQKMIAVILITAGLTLLST